METICSDLRKSILLKFKDCTAQSNTTYTYINIEREKDILFNFLGWHLAQLTKKFELIPWNSRSGLFLFMVVIKRDQLKFNIKLLLKIFLRG